MGQFKTIVEILQQRAKDFPQKKIFTFLENGETEGAYLTYQQLDNKSRQIAAKLRSNKLEGERALLLFPQGIEFVSALFGCFYAGVIAVPAYPPTRNKLDRIYNIVNDCTSKIILADQHTYKKTKKIAPDLINKKWLITDEINTSKETKVSITQKIKEGTVAYLQYTSGSTGNPKGVMIDHKNIINNTHFLKIAHNLSENDCSVSWLPLFHDWGLVEGILLSIYANYPHFLMAPTDFVKKPYRWLKALSTCKATVTKGPNFAYELCTNKISEEEIKQLDLSNMKYFGIAAEPIWEKTLQDFILKFQKCGMKEKMFYPCYGMAEATLKITGIDIEKPYRKVILDKAALKENKVLLKGENEDGITLVGCGYPRLDMQVQIIDPNTFISSKEDEIGEIWIKGGSVASGYWEKPAVTTQYFNQTIRDTKESGFFRTGDLGFWYQQELFIAGRLKDMVIIRGQNYYPQDIERIVQASHPSLQIGATIVFSIVEGVEKIVAVQEIKRTFYNDVDSQKVLLAIQKKISEALEVKIDIVVLVAPLTIPKTSSGKIMRNKCKSLFLSKNLSVIDQLELSELSTTKKQDYNENTPIETIIDLQNLLIHLFILYSENVKNSIVKETAISTIGIDSIKIADITVRLETILGVNLDPSLFWEFQTIERIADFIYNRKLTQIITQNKGN